MGHYDSCIYSDEAENKKITEKMIKNLEKKVQKNKLIVYDDYQGMLNIRIARKSKILSYKNISPTSWEIFLKDKDY